MKFQQKPSSDQTTISQKWFPGFAYFYESMSLLLTEFFGTPIYRLIAIISFFTLTLSQYFLAQKYWHLLDPIITSYPDGFIFCVVLTIAYMNILFGNTVFYLIYRGKYEFFEKFKGNNDPWPWESNSELFRQKDLPRMLKLNCINFLIVLPLTLIYNMFAKTISYQKFSED